MSGGSVFPRELNFFVTICYTGHSLSPRIRIAFLTPVFPILQYLHEGRGVQEEQSSSISSLLSPAHSPTVTRALPGAPGIKGRGNCGLDIEPDANIIFEDH